MILLHVWNSSVRKSGIPRCDITPRRYTRCDHSLSAQRRILKPPFTSEDFELAFAKNAATVFAPIPSRNVSPSALQMSFTMMARMMVKRRTGDQRISGDRSSITFLILPVECMSHWPWCRYYRVIKNKMHSLGKNSSWTDWSLTSIKTTLVLFCVEVTNEIPCAKLPISPKRKKKT